MHDLLAGRPPALGLKREAAFQALIVILFLDGCFESAYDCSEGGLAIALAECTFDSGGLGVSADITAVGDDPAYAVNATLFGESASRIVISVVSDQLDTVMTAAADAGVTAREIGQIGRASCREEV